VTNPVTFSATQARVWVLSGPNRGGKTYATLNRSPGGNDPGEAPLLAASDVVVAFGSDDALPAIRANCSPGARFVPYGHRISLGRLTRPDVATLDATGADLIARDALLYDGEGCLSLHALFVEGYANLYALDPATGQPRW